MGLPSDFVARFALDDIQGSHALGHTRMATESRVTTEHSHPFSTGLDLCLVHNGSLSNHNRLRLELRREGIEFQTDNDTEVAAGYLTWKLREGASLEQALEGCLDDLDGFYTFAVGTADGFAVLRDPIACKPAVMAETDDWVAMASEYRAIAVLPGADDARDVGARAGAGVHLGAGARLMADRDATSAAESFDLATTPLRELNARLHALAGMPTRSRRTGACVNPSGAHALAVGLDAPVEVEIEGHVGYYCAGMNKQATVRVHGNAGVGVAENIMSGHGRRRRQREPVGGRDRPRRPRRRPRRRLGALRHLDEGRRHRRARLGRPHERVHGPEGPPRRLRRRRRRARRLDLRGAPLRARHRREPRRRLRREGAARRAPSPSCARCSSAPGSTTPTPGEFRRYGSARRLYNFNVDNAGEY